MAATLRCFVALELDEPARRDLAAVIARLREADADVKWVRPENLHLTLEFLGDVPVSGTGAVVGALTEALTAGPRAFSFRLAGMGTFGSSRSPRVIWVGLDEGKETVGELAARVAKALAPLGYLPPERGFTPHLTLGRCRSGKNAAQLMAAVAALRDYRGPAVAARRVVLFQSELRPSGPIYRPLAAVDLPGGR